MKEDHSEAAVGQAVMLSAEVQLAMADWTEDHCEGAPEAQGPSALLSPQGPPRGPCGEAAARAARAVLAARTVFMVVVVEEWWICWVGDAGAAGGTMPVEMQMQMQMEMERRVVAVTVDGEAI